MRLILALGVVLLVVSMASAQTAPIKVRVVYDTTDANSSAVALLFIQKLAAQPKFFTVVNGDDRNLGVIADCYRDSSSDPYSCHYVASEWVGSTQAFLGGAVVVKKSAEDAATALFASVLLDVSERWNSTNRSLLIGELETCLALTESSCAVPQSLVAELKVKSINLSQYLRIGPLKP
jgi:hypothetical protein